MTVSGNVHLTLVPSHFLIEWKFCPWRHFACHSRKHKGVNDGMNLDARAWYGPSSQQTFWLIRARRRQEKTLTMAPFSDRPWKPCQWVGIQYQETGLTKWNAAINDVIKPACAIPALTCENVCREKDLLRVVIWTFKRKHAGCNQTVTTARNHYHFKLLVNHEVVSWYGFVRFPVFILCRTQWYKINPAFERTSEETDRRVNMADGSLCQWNEMEAVLTLLVSPVLLLLWQVKMSAVKSIQLPVQQQACQLKELLSILGNA